MKKKIRQVVCGIIAFVGVVLMIGTAGASDLGDISVTRMIIQLLIGLAMFAGGIFAGGWNKQ